MDEAQARAAFLNEALSFTGTRYHHMGRVKGAGVDCLTFIVCAAQNAGIIGEVEIPHYSPQFNLHRDAETYLEGLLRYCREVETPKPGDIVLWKFGRVFAHAAVVIEWPIVIHAHAMAGVIQEDAHAARWLEFMDDKGNAQKPRPRKFFTYW